MPIDVFGSLKSISDKLFAGFLGKIVESPLWISLILAFVIVLLVVLIYPAKSGTKFTGIIKLFIYVFLGSFGVMLLHDSSIRYHFRREYLGTEVEDIAESIMHPPPANSPPPAAAPAAVPPAAPAAPAAPPVSGAGETPGLPYIVANAVGGNPFVQN